MLNQYQEWTARILAAIAGAGFNVALSNNKMSPKKMTIIFMFGVFVGTFFGSLAVIVLEKHLKVEIIHVIDRIVIGCFLAALFSSALYVYLARKLRGPKSPKEHAGGE